MKKSKLAQEIQDEIFKRMPVERKIKLALDFSLFCLKLQKEDRYGNRRTLNKSGQNFRKP